MNIRTTIAALAAITLSLAACDEKDAQERFIDIKLNAGADSITDETGQIVAWPRNILIEDYTGQKCTNCPEVHRLIEQLTSNEAFGQRIIPVAIHAGSFGIGQDSPGADKLGWLMQPVGNEYADALNLNAYPKCVVGRCTGPLDKDDIAKAVSDQLTQTTTANITLEASATDEIVQISATVATSAPLAARLQLWITEDNITAYQLDGGKSIMKYNHNHVLREAINGTWGEDITAAKAAPAHITRQTAAKSYWNTDNCHVIAILYTDEMGVIQAVQARITNNN